MENLIIYIGKASALLAIFILAYHALLRKETFFNTNRWYLLAGLVTSALLPLLTYTKIIWIDPAPVQEYNPMELHKLVMLQHAQALAKPEFTINWFDVMAGMYFTGVLFFSIRFVIDLRSLRKLINGQPIMKNGKFLLVDSPAIKSPFSFFNYIVYNSKALQPEELESIINHEKVHSSQKHSLDMILGQLFCIAFWFNPFAWMYKKSISQNLEFIADAEASRLIADKKAYQKTLLKITVQPECIAITNHFYQSLIKKRIVMLNKQQSKKRNSWKYTIVLPALAAFMLLFQVRTVAQEKEGTKKFISEKTKVAIEVTKDSKDEDLEADKKVFKDQFNTDVNFENIKRNQNKEITAIKVTVKDQGQSQVYEVAGNSPISPFTIEVEKDNSGRNTIMFGTGNSNYHISAADFHIMGDDLKNKMNDSTRISKHRIIKSYGMGDVPPSMNHAMEPQGAMFSRATIGSSDMLVVVDGAKQKKGEAALKLPPGREIDRINIIEGKEAKKKYGKEAKKGVVEITTKRGGGARFMQMTPQGFEFEFPDVPNGEAFGFNFEMPDMPNMEGFNLDFNFEELERILEHSRENGDIQILSEMLSPEEREKFQAEIEKSQAELKKRMSELDYNKMWEGQNFRKELKESREDSRKEIEEARKEIEKARKELEEARKELQKTRANLNKKA